MMPEVIINNQEAEPLNLSIFVNINGISFFTYNPVNFKASRIYRSTFSRPQKVENLILEKRRMNISIGNDHTGVDLKVAIISHLEKKSHQLFNHGTNSQDSVDYADFIHPVAEDVEKKRAKFDNWISSVATRE